MTYNLITFPRFRHIDPSTGEAAADWKVYTYQAGTATAQTTYSDKDCTIPNTNPVVLDSNGEAIIYVNVPIKVILTRPADDAGSPYLTQDYLAVEQDVIIRGTYDSVTNNYYAVSSVPAQTVLSDNLMLIFTPGADSETTLTSQAFTGVGINDCTFYGPYIGTTSGSTFNVEIDGVGTGTGGCDTFKWRKDAGAYTATVDIVGGNQALIEGVYVQFSKTTGHTVLDLWTLTVERPVRINLDSLGDKLVYKNVAGTLEALGAGDMKANYPSTLVYSETSGAWILNNPAAPDTSSSTINVSRPRREYSAAHTVVDDDWGYELSFTGSRIVTLPTASDFANQYVYITNAGTGTITINADGTEKIYWPFETTGKSTILLQPGGYATIQLASNSVDWHVLTASTRQHGVAVYTYSGGVQTWVCPDNVFTAYFSGCASGGGGASAYTLGTLNGCNAGQGGFAGETCQELAKTVVPGTSYNITINTGGTAGASGAANNGGNGGNTTVNTPVAITLIGGNGGTAGYGIYATNTFAHGTAGRSCAFGGGGHGGACYVNGTSVGGTANGYGAGGGGGAAWDAAGTGQTVAGGAGAPGFMVIRW